MRGREKLVWGQGSVEVQQDIQRGRRGVVPVRIVTVMNKEENACNTLEQQQQRWRRHLAKLPNI